MIEILKIYRYRERRVVNGAIFPQTTDWIQEVISKIPSNKRDNHQVVLVDVGPDDFGRSCEVAIWLHDNLAYVSDPHNIKDGDEAEMYREWDKRDGK